MPPPVFAATDKERLDILAGARNPRQSRAVRWSEMHAVASAVGKLLSDTDTFADAVGLASSAQADQILSAFEAFQTTSSEILAALSVGTTAAPANLVTSGTYAEVAAATLDLNTYVSADGLITNPLIARVSGEIQPADANPTRVEVKLQARVTAGAWAELGAPTTMRIYAHSGLPEHFTLELLEGAATDPVAPDFDEFRLVARLAADATYTGAGATLANMRISLSQLNG
jgi:hypothetical protein